MIRAFAFLLPRDLVGRQVGQVDLAVVEGQQRCRRILELAANDLVEHRPPRQ